MTKQQAAAAIRHRFPDAKPLFLYDTDHHFINGLGVEFKGQRNAIAFPDTPENWRDAADRLMQWLERQ